MYDTHQSTSFYRAQRPNAMDAVTSSPPRGPSCYLPTQSQQHNPYARMPSRRAIACVTCAKAKTKCNKDLPSCSRCITKGITCQPRSTRRTSDNSNRSNVKKPSKLPRRKYATNAVSRLDLHAPFINLPSSQEPGVTYAASHVASESTATVSSQDVRISGYPMLDSRPLQGLQVSDDCFAYVESSEYDPNVFAWPVGANNYLNPGITSPQTPSPAVLYEPVSVLNVPDCHLYHDLWSSEAHVSDEVGFDVSVTSVLPEMWPTPDSTIMMPVAQVPWPLSDLSDPPRYKLDEPASHLVETASPTQYQFRNDLGTIRPEWTFYGPTVADMVVTSAPFMYDLDSATSYAPIWEVPSIL